MRLAQYLKGAREERQPKNEITECIFIIIMVICKETSLTSGFWRHIWFEWCCKWPEHSTRIYIGMLADAVAITNQHTHDIYELWKTAAFCRIYIKRAHVTGRALLIIVSCVFISAGDRRCGHCRQRSTLSLSLLAADWAMHIFFLFLLLRWRCARQESCRCRRTRRPRLHRNRISLSSLAWWLLSMRSLGHHRSVVTYAAQCARPSRCGHYIFGCGRFNSIIFVYFIIFFSILLWAEWR